MGLLVQRGGSPRRALLVVAVIWAIGFAVLAALMAHAIITQDVAAIRFWFLWQLAWSPLIALWGYLGVREAWSGDEHNGAAAIGAIVIVALVFSIGQFVYPQPIAPGLVKRMDGIDPKASRDQQLERLKLKYGLE